MAKLRKLLACETVASSGGKCFKKLKRGQINPDSGLYDANGVLVALWDTLLANYGMDDDWDWGTTFGEDVSGSPTNVLKNNSELANGTKFVIDGSIQIIGGGAFQDCTQLTNVYINEGVKEIWNSGFSGCTSLESIVMPDSMEFIGMTVFRDCTNLKSITIGKGMWDIRALAFMNCTSLTDVYFRGTKAQWNNLLNYLGNGNECLTNATIHYNSQ